MFDIYTKWRLNERQLYKNYLRRKELAHMNYKIFI